jgi:hypothetical protein
MCFLGKRGFAVVVHDVEELFFASRLEIHQPRFVAVHEARPFFMLTMLPLPIPLVDCSLHTL